MFQPIQQLVQFTHFRLPIIEFRDTIVTTLNQKMTNKAKEDDAWYKLLASRHATLKAAENKLTKAKEALQLAEAELHVSKLDTMPHAYLEGNVFITKLAGRVLFVSDPTDYDYAEGEEVSNFRHASTCM